MKTKQTIRAIQWTGENIKEVKRFVGLLLKLVGDEKTILIPSKNSIKKATINDYIILTHPKQGMWFQELDVLNPTQFKQKYKETQ
jgi:hypothetical protein